MIKLVNGHAGAIGSASLLMAEAEAILLALRKTFERKLDSEFADWAMNQIFEEYQKKVSEKSPLEPKEDKEGIQMKRSDLKSRMVVETREGDRHMVIREGEGFVFMPYENHHYLTNIDEDLTSVVNENRDIMKVYDRVSCFEQCETTTDLLWKRKEPRKMTLKKLERVFGYPVEIVEEEE